MLLLTKLSPPLAKHSNRNSKGLATLRALFCCLCGLYIKEGAIFHTDTS